MSSCQRSDDFTVLIDRDDLDAVREQSLLTLEANLHFFEEIGSFGGEARRALARIYREAFDVLDAIGWDADDAPARGAEEDGATTGAGGRGVWWGEERERVEVPLTVGHVEQLRVRRFELGHANIDKVEHSVGWTVEDLEPNWRQAWALDRLFGVWAARVAAG
jgi:hypothetical protein